ncbi:RIP metalloprotease RseP [Velocimicrobium porci]|uniref:Zinc metalloprotease n=1 Tax=Velocimicrobium porci TaxID=2606634 RepID=A0A6L5Y0M0_9FIRM|nr:RIP metalloprotease RseP [Velocimicrobium porci]MSS64625.1 RIP metalloprotease RseP [Velocimicrobium porci]
MNIIVAILIFTVIVVIHELGHFLLAKKNGVSVTEFSVGMGPRIITYAKTNTGKNMVRFFISQKNFENCEEWEGKTKYSWKIFPVGGSCMMVGEDETVEDENAFNKKGVWARISVIFAGPFFNFILAFVLSMILIGSIGYDPSIVSSVDTGYPMSEAGVKKGDKILEINGEKISLAREIGAYFQFNPLTEDSSLDITYERDGKIKSVTVQPKLDKELNRYRLGFGYATPYKKANPAEVVKYSFVEVKYWIKTTVQSLGQLIVGKIGKDEIAGPVGIVDMVGGVIEQSSEYGIKMVLLNVMNMCILLSANLGVMNLLPIPALDGGRLVFLFIEALRGKPIDPEKEGMVHLIGLVALMIIMVLVMFNDISRLV